VTARGASQRNLPAHGVVSHEGKVLEVRSFSETVLAKMGLTELFGHAPRHMLRSMALTAPLAIHRAAALATSGISARIFSMIVSGRMPSASASKLRIRRWRRAG